MRGGKRRAVVRTRRSDSRLTRRGLPVFAHREREVPQSDFALLSSTSYSSWLNYVILAHEPFEMDVGRVYEHSAVPAHLLLLDPQELRRAQCLVVQVRKLGTGSGLVRVARASNVYSSAAPAVAVKVGVQLRSPHHPQAHSVLFAACDGVTQSVRRRAPDGFPNIKVPTRHESE